MGRKTRSISKTEDDQIGNKIPNDIWYENVKEIIKNEVKVLSEEITCLREEVRYLKESNIQLVHLLTNINLNEGKLRNNQNENKKKDIKVLQFLNNTEYKNNSERSQSNSVNINRSNLENNLKSNIETEEMTNSAPVQKKYQDKTKTNFSLNNNDLERMHTNKRKPVSNFNKIKGFTGTSTGNTGLKVATKRFQVFISRLHPSTSMTDLQTYLNQNFPDSKCEELHSRFPEHYKSFKISIEENHKDQIMDPNFWPSGVYINKFFRKTGQFTNNSGY